MTPVTLAARVRCKNKACGGKVPLTGDQVRLLSGKLSIPLTCPTCARAFVASLVPPPKEPKAAEVLPAPVVPIGAERAAPPFRPLTTPHVQDEVAAADAPAPPVRPAAEAAPFQFGPQPGLPRLPFDPLPFSPIRPGHSAAGSSGASGVGGWWNRLPKKTQNLALVAGIVLAGGFAAAVKFRGATAAPPPPVVQPEDVAPSRRPPQQVRAAPAVSPTVSDDANDRTPDDGETTPAGPPEPQTPRTPR